MINKDKKYRTRSDDWTDIEILATGLRLLNNNSVVYLTKNKSNGKHYLFYTDENGHRPGTDGSLDLIEIKPTVRIKRDVYISVYAEAGYLSYIENSEEHWKREGANTKIRLPIDIEVEIGRDDSKEEKRNG